MFLLLVLIIAGAAFYVWNGMQPTTASNEPVTFTIERGMGTAEIAELLQDKQLIKNEFVFKGYLKYTSQGSRFQAGKYSATPGTKIDELITMLNEGNVLKDEMLSFTIPEGYTVEQMADKLSEEGFVDKPTFMQIVNNPSSIKSALVADIPKDAGIKHALEGYLFPETYELNKGSTEADIIDTMTSMLQQKLESIDNLEQKLKDRGLRLHELLTVASLVEREVVVEQERSLVAGVIYNRLEIGQKLEIDATVQYSLDEPKERLLFKDLKVDSPYNTYRIEGLPPGPISNPSLASIEAALSPESTPYLFYVTKKDGSQGHLFAKTYKEHLQNIEKSNSKSQ
ncbi:UPF0755 protein [Paenibacillus sp. DS2015]|uniref:endolytic transglycosylase MltG n=1 Tax=Paenibacillus sp. DS2015 TaxID=3373917 RepID=UPI003D24C5D1